jgi:hypothetical protein
MIAGLAAWPAAGDSPPEPPPAGESGYPSNLALVRSVAQTAIVRLLGNLGPTGPRVRVRVEPYHETAWLVEEIAGSELRARGLVVVSEPAVPPAAPPAPGSPEAQAAAALAVAAQAAAAQAGQSPPPSLQQLGQLVGAQGDSAAGDSAATHAAAPPAPAATAPATPPPVPVDAELRLRVVDLGLKYTGTHRTRPFFGQKKVERYATANLQAELRDSTGDLVQWTGNGDAARIDEVPKDALPILEGQHYPFTPPSLPPHSAGKIIEPIVVTAVIVGLVFLFVSNRS